MTPEQYLKRAHQRLHATHVLLEDGAFEDACNRAYYAVFEATRAALAAVGQPVPKTHRGLNTQFHEHVVRAYRENIRDDIGQSLSKLEDIRLMADYMDKPPHPEQARDAFNMAKAFVNAIQSTFLPDTDLMR